MLSDNLYKCINVQTKALKTRKRRLVIRTGIKDGAVSKKKSSKYLFENIRNKKGIQQYLVKYISFGKKRLEADTLEVEKLFVHLFLGCFFVFVFCNTKQ